MNTRIPKRLTVAPRSHQTQSEISALRDNIMSVGTIINGRWTLVIVLVLYSAIGFFIHLSETDFRTLAGYMAIPAIAVALVVIYNFVFLIYKHQFANIAAANFMQLLLDVSVVSVLVYFSGGIESWFWVIYIVSVFEMAIIAEKKSDVYRLTAVIIGLLSFIIWGTYGKLIPHITVPLSSGEMWDVLSYVSLKYLWEVAVIIGVSLISTKLVFDMRASLSRSRNLSMLDEMTGLFSREYFKRLVISETSRAEYFNNRVYIALIDLDNFSTINYRFGIEAGDMLIMRVAKAIKEEVEHFSEGEATSNIVSRYSGEEFALLIVENPSAHDLQPIDEDVEALLEKISESISNACVNDVTVTASIGYAGLPKDAFSGSDLLDRADEALACAISRGGNKISSYENCKKSKESVEEYSTAPLETVSKYLNE